MKKTVSLHTQGMTTITLQLSPELEQKLRESIARRDAQSIRQLLADAFAPTVEALLGQTHSQFNDEELKDEDELEASDTWSESDQLELTTFSLQYAASLFPESEETTQ